MFGQYDILSFDKNEYNNISAFLQKGIIIYEQKNS